MTRTTLIAVAAVTLLGAGLVAGCGGDSGGDEDPQQVLDETFSNDEDVNSGVIDLSVSGEAEGEDGGSFDASLSGPFQGDEGQTGEFPQLDLSASVSAEGSDQSIDFEGGLIATADQAFVSYQDTTYEVPKDFYEQLKAASEEAQKQAAQGGDEDAGAIFESLGIDPSTWLTNLENEGDEDVEGTETIHIHGDADVPQIVDDLQQASEQTGAAGQIDEDDVQQVEDAVDEASMDVYSGKDDRILRRLDLNLALTPPEDSGATIDSLDLELSLTLSDVNADQTIEAPSDAQPFSQLESDLGLPPGLLEGALSGGGLSSGLGGGSLGGGGGGVPSIPGSGGGSGGGIGGNTDDYAKCLQQASTPEDINACSDEL